MSTGDANTPHETMINTTADTTHLLLYAFFTLISSISKAQSLKDVRAAALPACELAEDFLNGVESGQIQLPFNQHGSASVIEALKLYAHARQPGTEPTLSGD